MEGSMGKMIGQLPTDPEIQRHLRQAHVLRAAYIRAALGRLLARCRALFARPRASAERSPYSVLRAGLDRDTLRADNHWLRG
jgi:hypothetical protein